LSLLYFLLDTGIGYGCRQNILEPAKKDTFFKFQYLNTYIQQATIWREAFLKEFEKTKFRSEFKKSFFESIKSSERVSKKQLEIVKTNLSYKDLYLYNEIEQKCKDVYNTNFRCFSPSTDEEIEFYSSQIEIYKKSYLRNRKKTDKDE